MNGVKHRYYLAYIVMLSYMSKLTIATGQNLDNLLGGMYDSVIVPVAC